MILKGRQVKLVTGSHWLGWELLPGSRRFLHRPELGRTLLALWGKAERQKGLSSWHLMESVHSGREAASCFLSTGSLALFCTLCLFCLNELEVFFLRVLLKS